MLLATVTSTAASSDRVTPEDSAATRLVVFQRFLAAFGLALMTSSWPLWTPQTVYPQVPLFGWARGLPMWLDWIFCGTLLASLVALLTGGALRRSAAAVDTAPAVRPWRAAVSRAGWLGLLLAFAAACLTDQHRCQAWAWQFALVAILMLLARKSSAALTCVRLLVISVYLYSGLSKFDHAFITGYGQQLWSALLLPAGISLELQSETLRRVLAAGLPLAEFAAGLALFWPRSRRWGTLAVILMHGLLILALGPFGLNHEPGVLFWNMFFIAQAVVLFGSARRLESAQVPESDRPGAATRSASRLRAWSDEQALALALTAMLLVPLLEPWGWIDPWPGWALYAANPERVVVQIDVSGEFSLPDQLQPFFTEPEFYSRWGRLDLGRWSASALGAPIYPEDRFRFGAARAIGLRWPSLRTRMRVQFQSRADRWSGVREQTPLDYDELPEFCDERFVLNWRPRENLALQPF